MSRSPNYYVGVALLILSAGCAQKSPEVQTTVIIRPPAGETRTDISNVEDAQSLREQLATLISDATRKLRRGEELDVRIERVKRDEQTVVAHGNEIQLTNRYSSRSSPFSIEHRVDDLFEMRKLAADGGKTDGAHGFPTSAESIAYMTADCLISCVAEGSLMLGAKDDVFKQARDAIPIVDKDSIPTPLPTVTKVDRSAR